MNPDFPYNPDSTGDPVRFANYPPMAPGDRPLPAESQQLGTETAPESHSGRHWMHLLMCAPMLLVVGYLGPDRQGRWGFDLLRGGLHGHDGRDDGGHGEDGPTLGRRQLGASPLSPSTSPEEGRPSTPGYGGNTRRTVSMW